jgi:hypothetical protein
VRLTVILVWICAVAGLFVFFHTGSREDSACLRSGAGTPEGISLWPPGTICSGGEPVTESVYINQTFPLVAVALGVVLFGAVALRRDLRPRPPV